MAPETAGVLYDKVVCATEETEEAAMKVNNTILDFEVNSENGDKIISNILDNGMSRAHATKLLEEAIALPEGNQEIDDALNQLLDQHEQCKQDKKPNCDLMIYEAVKGLQKVEHFIMTTRCDDACGIRVIGEALDGAIKGAAAGATAGALVAATPTAGIGAPAGALAGAVAGGTLGAIAGAMKGYNPSSNAAPEKPCLVAPAVP